MKNPLKVLETQWLVLIAISLFLQLLLWTQFPPDLRAPAFSDIELRLGPGEVAETAGTPAGLWHEGFLLRTEGPWEILQDGSGGITPEGGTIEAGFQIATPGAPWVAVRLRVEGSSGSVWSARIRRDFESQFLPRIQPGEWAEFGGEAFPGIESGSEAPLQLFLFPARGEGDPPPGALTGLRLELKASPQEPLSPEYPGVLVGGFLPLALGLFLRYVGGRDRPRAPAFAVLIGGIAVLAAAFHEPAWLQYLWAATTALFLGAGVNAAMHATLNTKQSDRWADPAARKTMATWSLLAGLICVAVWMRWEAFEQLRGAALLTTGAPGLAWPDGLLAMAAAGTGNMIAAAQDATGHTALRLAGLALLALMVAAYFAVGWMLLGRRGGLLMAALAAASPFAVEGMRLEPGLAVLAMAGLPMLLAARWLWRGRFERGGAAAAPLALLGALLLLLGLPVLAVLAVLGVMAAIRRFTENVPVLPVSLAGVVLILISTLSLPHSLNAPMTRVLGELPGAIFGEQWFLGLLALGVLLKGDDLLRAMREGCRETFSVVAICALGMAAFAASGWRVQALLTESGQATAVAGLTAVLFPLVAVAWAAGTLELANLLRDYARRQVSKAAQNAQEPPSRLR